MLTVTPIADVDLADGEGEQAVNANKSNKNNAENFLKCLNLAPFFGTPDRGRSTAANDR